MHDYKCVWFFLNNPLSQISVLSAEGVRHFFTATPDPGVSLFKPLPAFETMANWPEGRLLAEQVKSPVAFPEKAKV